MYVCKIVNLVTFNYNSQSRVLWSSECGGGWGPASTFDKKEEEEEIQWTRLNREWVPTCQIYFHFRANTINVNQNDTRTSFPFGHMSLRKSRRKWVPLLIHLHFQKHWSSFFAGRFFFYSPFKDVTILFFCLSVHPLIIQSLFIFESFFALVINKLW